MRVLHLVATLLALVAAALVFGAGGCSPEGVGIESCRQIEEARCRQAPACGIELSPPVHRDGDGRDVDGCIRFYRDACLHGFEATQDRGTLEVRACVAAINTGDCAVVKSPQTHPDCSFLIPVPPAPIEAGADAGVDAATIADAGAGG